MSGSQIIMAALFAFTVTQNLIHHGEETSPSTYNFGLAVISVLIEMTILGWGGFWTN